MSGEKDIRLTLVEIESRCMDFRNELLRHHSEEWANGICFGRLKTAVDDAMKYAAKLKDMIRLNDRNVVRP